MDLTTSLAAAMVTAFSGDANADLLALIETARTATVAPNDVNTELWMSL